MRTSHEFETQIPTETVVAVADMVDAPAEVSWVYPLMFDLVAHVEADGFTFVVDAHLPLSVVDMFHTCAGCGARVRTGYTPTTRAEYLGAVAEIAARPPRGPIGRWVRRLSGTCTHR